MSRLRLTPALATVALLLSAATVWSVPAAAVPTGPAPGTVLIADVDNSRVVAVAPDGSQTTVGTGLLSPYGAGADTHGNVFIADTGHSRVVEVAPDGTQTPLPFSGLVNPTDVAVDPTGDVYVVDNSTGILAELNPAGVQTTLLTGLSSPYGIALDAAGDVFVTDSGHALVLEVAADGTSSTVPLVGLSFPSGVAIDAAGNLYVVDDGNGNVIEWTADGTQTTLDNRSGAAGVAVDGGGNLYYSELASNTVVKRAPNGTTSTFVGSGLNFPVGLGIVPGLAQTITFTSTPPSHAEIGQTYPVTATGGGSGNPVTFTRNPSSADNCTVTNDGLNSATVTFTGAGICAVFAHQDGSAGYQPAPGHIRQRIEVYKKAQTISFQTTPPARPVVGSHYDVAASATSGGDVTFTVSAAAASVCAITAQPNSAATVSFTGPGSCVVFAHQAGDDTWAAAPRARQRFRVYAN